MKFVYMCLDFLEKGQGRRALMFKLPGVWEKTTAMFFTNLLRIELERHLSPFRVGTNRSSHFCAEWENICRIGEMGCLSSWGTIK